MRKIPEEKMIYKFVVFKLKGHTMWRMCDEKSMQGNKDLVEPKYILVDRLTGKIEIR